MRVFVSVRDGKEVTKEKYHYCRNKGTHWSKARYMCHWRWSKIFRYFGETDLMWDRVYQAGTNHLKSINERGKL